MNINACGEDEIENFTSKVDHILKNRSRIGVKTLRIVFRYSNAKASNVDSWLQTVVTPGIENSLFSYLQSREHTTTSRGLF